MLGLQCAATDNYLYF